MTKEELQKTIGRNLSRIRCERKMTQDEVAEQIGISTTFYANLECGNKMMSLVTLRKVADMFCVSTDSILYDGYFDHSTVSVMKALQNQPEELIKFVDKLIQLCIDEHIFPQGGFQLENEQK